MRFGGALAALAVVAVAGCGHATVVTPATPAPPACGLAEFALAPGIALPPVKPRPPAQDKSQPLRYAEAMPVKGGVGLTGKWADAGPGWKAWRTWLRSENASSLAVHLKPLALPPHATLWVCSPDRTTRQPFAAQRPAASSEYWSPSVPGPELWLELQVPAGAEGGVELVIAGAFAGFP